MTASNLLTLGLTNAVLATLLALAGWLLTRLWPNPHVASAVWLVVLLKLVTPPVLSFQIPLPWEGEAPAEPPRPSALISVTGEPRASARGSTTRDIARSRPLASQTPLPEEKDRGEAMPHASVARSTLPPPGEGQGGGERLSTHVPVQTEPPAPAAGFHLHLSTLLAALWLTGTLAAVALTTTRVLRFRRALRRTATPAPELRRLAAKVAADLGLRRCPLILCVPTNVGPMVWAAAVPPVVIVPRPLWDRLGEAERETLLAHELAHLARGDHWVRRFEAIILALYWWLPTTWLAVRRREAAAESCCDALVLATYPEGARAYAEALYVAAGILSAPRRLALASGLGGPAELKERLTMIAHARVPRRLSRPARVTLALAAVTALTISGRFVQADPPSAMPEDAAAPAAGNGSEPEVPPGRTATTTPAAAPGEAADTAADAAEEAAGSAASVDQALPNEGNFRGGFGPPGMRTGGGMGMGPSGRRGFSRQPPVQLSAEVREKMIASLVAVIEQPNQPAEVKARALRSLGQIGPGSPAAKKALLAAADRVRDDEEKLAVAEALNAIGSPKGVETMWEVLESTKNWGLRAKVVQRLEEAGAVPATPEAVRTLALLAAHALAEESRNNMFGGTFVGNTSPFRSGLPLDRFFGRFAGAAEMLRRLTSSGDGVRLLVETIRTTEEPSQAPFGYVEMPEGSKSRVEDIYGTQTPVRDLLLPLLGMTVPASDEIAVALVEALSGDDPAIREAAAQALGNAGPEVAIPGMGSIPGMSVPNADARGTLQAR